MKLPENKKISVDLGCGMKKLDKGDGWLSLGIDNRSFKGVDYVIHLGKDKLPFEDDSVDYLYTSHLLEHLYPEELFFLVEECFRVLKPQGTFDISVPKGDTLAYYIHPDHKIHYLPETFSFFQVPADGVDPHGYLKGFWHVTANVDESNPHAVKAYMYPNKPNGRYEYKKIKLFSDIIKEHEETK